MLLTNKQTDRQTGGAENAEQEKAGLENDGQEFDGQENDGQQHSMNAVTPFMGYLYLQRETTLQQCEKLKGPRRAILAIWRNKR